MLMPYSLTSTRILPDFLQSRKPVIRYIAWPMAGKRVRERKRMVETRGRERVRERTVFQFFKDYWMSFLKINVKAEFWGDSSLWQSIATFWSLPLHFSDTNRFRSEPSWAEVQKRDQVASKRSWARPKIKQRSLWMSQSSLRWSAHKNQRHGK